MSVAATAGESSAQLSPVSSLNDMSEAIDAVSSGAARQGSKTLDVEDDMHGQRVLQGLVRMSP